MKTQAETVRKETLEALKKAPDVPKEFSEFLAKGKIVTKGNLVEATVTMKVDEAVTLIMGFLGVGGKAEPKPNKPTEDKKPTADKKPSDPKPPVEKKP